MEGEKMVRKSKVGSTGRFGARYGRKAKRTVRDIEDKMHAKHICPRCDRPGVKRTHAGIWKCKKCGLDILTAQEVMQSMNIAFNMSRELFSILDTINQ